MQRISVQHYYMSETLFIDQIHILVDFSERNLSSSTLNSYLKNLSTYFYLTFVSYLIKLGIFLRLYRFDEYFILFWYLEHFENIQIKYYRLIMKFYNQNIPKQFFKDNLEGLKLRLIRISILKTIFKAIQCMLSLSQNDKFIMLTFPFDTKNFTNLKTIFNARFKHIRRFSKTFEDFITHFNKNHSKLMQINAKLAVKSMQSNAKSTSNSDHIKMISNRVDQTRDLYKNALNLHNEYVIMAEKLFNNFDQNLFQKDFAKSVASNLSILDLLQNRCPDYSKNGKMDCRLVENDCFLEFYLQ